MACPGVMCSIWGNRLYIRLINWAGCAGDFCCRPANVQLPDSLCFLNVIIISWRFNVWLQSGMYHVQHSNIEQHCNFKHSLPRLMKYVLLINFPSKGCFDMVASRIVRTKDHCWFPPSFLQQRMRTKEHNCCFISAMLNFPILLGIFCRKIYPSILSYHQIAIDISLWILTFRQPTQACLKWNQTSFPLSQQSFDFNQRQGSYGFERMQGSMVVNFQIKFSILMQLECLCFHPHQGIAAGLGVFLSFLAFPLHCQLRGSIWTSFSFKVCLFTFILISYKRFLAN